jgi:hypothetical protein
MTAVNNTIETRLRVYLVRKDPHPAMIEDHQSLAADLKIHPRELKIFRHFRREILAGPKTVDREPIFSNASEVDLCLAYLKQERQELELALQQRRDVGYDAYRLLGVDPDELRAYYDHYKGIRGIRPRGTETERLVGFVEAARAARQKSQPEPLRGAAR